MKPAMQAYSTRESGAGIGGRAAWLHPREPSPDPHSGSNFMAMPLMQ
jgi:hypothetical protein